MMEEYVMDTSVENCSLNEKLLESLQSVDEAEWNDEEIMTVDHNENDIGNCVAKATKPRNERFKTPVKSKTHQSLEINTSTELNNLSSQQTPLKAMNTSVDSLVDAAELDSLLDGVEWSPMISSSEKQHISGYMRVLFNYREKICHFKSGCGHPRCHTLFMGGVGETRSTMDR